MKKSCSFAFAALLLSQAPAGLALANNVCDPDPTDPYPEICDENNANCTTASTEEIRSFSAQITTCMELTGSETRIVVSVEGSSGVNAQMVVRAATGYTTTTASNSSLSVGDKAAVIVLHPTESSYAADHVFELPLRIDMGTGTGSVTVRISLQSGSNVLHEVLSQSLTIS